MLELEEFELAEEYWLRALEFYLDLPDTERELARMNRKLGYLYATYGAYTFAIDYLEKARLMYPVVYPKRETMVAEICYNLGYAYGNAGELDKALEAYRRALHIYFQHERHLSDVGDTLSVLADIYRLKQDTQSAREFGAEALRAYENVRENDHPDVVALKIMLENL